MKKIVAFFVVTFIVFASIAFGQTKMIGGKKHIIFVDIPKNWVFTQSDQLPFFIKPDEKNVSQNTYMYVYGLDYDINPDLYGWIKGDNDSEKANHTGVKIDSLPLKFNNIKKDNYQTGRYHTMTYIQDNRKEVILVIECTNTIVTAVLSTNSDSEFGKYLPAFQEMVKTIKISKGIVKIEQ